MDWRPGLPYLRLQALLPLQSGSSIAPLLSALDNGIKTTMNQNMMEELMMAKSIGWVFYSSNTWLSSLCSMVFCMIFKVLDVT